MSDFSVIGSENISYPIRVFRSSLTVIKHLVMSEVQIFNDSFSAFGNTCDVVFIRIGQNFAEQTFQLVKREIKHAFT